MNMKSNSILLSKELSFRREEKTFNINKNTKKDISFKEKIDSFAKNENKDKSYDSKANEKSKLDKSKGPDQTKIKKNNKEDKEIKKENIKESDEGLINQESLEKQDSNIQAYLLSLLDNKIKADEVTDQEPLNSMDMNLDLKDPDLALVEQTGGKELLNELKESSSQVIADKVDLKTEVKPEETDENLEGRIVLSREDGKKVLIEDMNPLEKENESLDKILGKSVLAIEEDSGETVENIETQRIDKNDEIEVKLSGESIKSKESTEKLDLKAEELITDKTKVEINDKSFLVDEKQETNTVKNPEQNIEKSESIDMKKNIQEIAEKMRFTINNQKNLIKINLKPKSLGELTMEIELVKNVLTAKIMVDNEKTKQLIQDNLYQLKDEIKDTALEIKSFEVFVGSGNDFSKHSRGQFNFNQFNKKNKNNENLKKALKKSESIDYMESPIANDGSNQYLEGSLNLLA